MVSDDLLAANRAGTLKKDLTDELPPTVGWTEEELRGTLIVDVVHPDDREKTAAEVSNDLILFNIWTVLSGVAEQPPDWIIIRK